MFEAMLAPSDNETPASAASEMYKGQGEGEVEVRRHRGVSFCSRMKNEFKRPFFDLEEPTSPTQYIDVKRTFAPEPFVATLLVKLIWVGWTIQTLVQAIIDATTDSFFLAYLTHWGLIFSLAYFAMSFLCALKGRSLTQPPPGEPASLLVRVTWGLFSIAAPAELQISILYWTLQYDGDTTIYYSTIMTHAALAVLLIVDGFFINMIPLRMKQMILYVSFSVIYILWTLIHGLSGIGNPDRDEGIDDDDAIYSSLKWKNSTGGAIILSLLNIFLVEPLLFMIYWSLSLWSRWFKFEGARRRLYQGVASGVDEEGLEQPCSEDNEVFGA